MLASSILLRTHLASTLLAAWHPAGISAVNISCDSDKLCQDVRGGDRTDRPASIVYLPRGLPLPAEKYCIDATGGSDSSGPIYDYCGEDPWPSNTALRSKPFVLLVVHTHAPLKGSRRHTK